MNWACSFEFGSLFDHCLENLLLATEKVDEEDITPHEIRQSTLIVYPLPGSFVSEDMHFLLDNDVYEFKRFEYVASELYNPFLDPPNTETGSLDKATGDAGEATEQSVDQGVDITDTETGSLDEATGDASEATE